MITNSRLQIHLGNSGLFNSAVLLNGLVYGLVEGSLESNSLMEELMEWSIKGRME